MARSRTDYGPWASVYDALGSLYSLGSIGRAKSWHCAYLAADQRVLYAGCGTAREALDAARRGVRVTLLDSSAHMLSIARRRFERAGVAARFVEGTLEEHAAEPERPTYDAVTCHFFLNVFGRHELDPVLNTLLGLLTPGGRLFLADFAAPSPHPLLRLAQRAYYFPPLALFWILARNPWHELYDYRARLRQLRAPVTLRSSATFRVAGLPLYESLQLVRLGSAS